MDFDTARQEFPALARQVFLDAACVSLAPRCATEAIRRFLDLALECPSRSSTLHHIAMDELRAAARPAAARLIGADEAEIALVESTTHGLTVAAHAIPLGRGDRVLLSDLEFMQVAIPWLQLADRGVQVDVVPHRAGAVLAEDFAERMTPRTRVVVVSSVQWSTGYRCDLDAMSRLCRERGAWLVVDAIQQLGACPIDVRATPVDLLACGGHKWLNAPFGCGLLYVRRDRWDDLRPPMAGYLGVEPPEGGWGAYFQTPSIAPVRGYRFTRDARRYEIGGTANYPGAVGLAASLELIHALGQPAIAARIAALTVRLIEGLDRLGVTLVTPREPERRAGIVTFSVGDVDANLALMERFLDSRVLVSVRYTSRLGGVRASCHFYNDETDVDRLLAAIG